MEFRRVRVGKCREKEERNVCSYKLEREVTLLK